MQGNNYTKGEMIQWINNIVPDQRISAIEGLGGGTQFCLIVNHFRPESIPSKKIQYQAQTYQKANLNYQLLQQGFNKLGIKKNINPEKLISNNFYENFQLVCFLRQTFENQPRQKSQKSLNSSVNSSLLKPEVKMNNEIQELKNTIEQQQALEKQEILRGLLQNSLIPHHIRLKQINQLYNFGISEFNSPSKQHFSSEQKNDQQIVDEMLIDNNGPECKRYMESNLEKNIQNSLPNEELIVEDFSFMKNTEQKNQDQQQQSFIRSSHEQQKDNDDRILSPKQTPTLQAFSSSQQRILDIQQQNSLQSPEFRILDEKNNDQKLSEALIEENLFNDDYDNRILKDVNFQLQDPQNNEFQRKSLNNQNIFPIPQDMRSNQKQKQRCSAPVKKFSGGFFMNSNKNKNSNHISEESL